jgi:hypothetical protein
MPESLCRAASGLAGPRLIALNRGYLARIHRRGFVEDLSGAAGLVEDVVHVDVAGRAG